MDGYWLEDKLEKRRLAALARVQAREQARLHKKRPRRYRRPAWLRSRLREVAIVMLGLAVILLGFLIYEVGYKAVELYQQIMANYRAANPL